MSTRRLPRALAWSLAVIAVLAVAATVASVYVVRSTPMLRDRVVEALNERFRSKVELETLQVTALPRPKVSGSGLQLRHNGRTDVDPLITVKSFAGDASFSGLFDDPVRLRSITLDGLAIHLPPGGVKMGGSSGGSATPPAKRPSLRIDRIEAASAWLEMASRNPLKPPRVFDIHRMLITNFRPDAPAQFQASLTNPIPEGEIRTSGEFGPWVAEDPEQTPISGRYTLDNAHMSDIKGLLGTLSSTGEYGGRLERIEVRGETRSPDFGLTIARQPVPLNTTFKAVVDGTNGDTYLEEVQATLVNTLILARGAIVRAREIKGRHVTLDVAVTRGRIEDVMRLAMRPGKAPMTGDIAIKAKLLVPAGPEDVIDRMQLSGNFSLSQARFTSYNVQKRINVMSKRARGDEGSDDAESVVSDLSGTFVMRNASISFSNLTFAIPGARVELAGAYDLHAEAMDFKGNLLLDASLADTTSGLKAVAARIVQPFFRRPGGGSKLPIKVQGTRGKPSFGLDLKKAFLPG